MFVSALARFLRLLIVKDFSVNVAIKRWERFLPFPVSAPFSMNDPWCETTIVCEDEQMRQGSEIECREVEESDVRMYLLCKRQVLSYEGRVGKRPIGRKNKLAFQLQGNLRIFEKLLFIYLFIHFFAYFLKFFRQVTNWHLGSYFQKFFTLPSSPRKMSSSPSCAEQFRMCPRQKIMIESSAEGTGNKLRN